MVELRQGNLLEADAEALVNTVNCVGVMGKGIALQFRQTYPENYAVYRRACADGLLRPGRLLTVELHRLGLPRFIINFPTKRHWRQPSRLEDLESGLLALVREVRDRAITSIAVPPLGCGNGGLDWSLVRPLIEAALGPVAGLRTLLYAPSAATSPRPQALPPRAAPLTRAKALLVQLLDVYGQPGYGVGRVEVQKLCYFLQEAGEPLKLAFVKGQYGPYAENLNHLLQAMEGLWIRGYGDRTGASEMRPTPEALSEAPAVIAADVAVQERLRRVASLIEGFETPFGLELLASVHWLATREQLPAGDEAGLVAGLRAWSQRKGDRYQARHVRIAAAHLQALSWLP